MLKEDMKARKYKPYTAAAWANDTNAAAMNMRGESDDVGEAND